MSQNEKFQDFEHPYNLSKYFQKKGIDSNNVLWKRQNTNGFIKEQSFLSSGSKTLYSLHKEKKGPVCEKLEFYWSLSSSAILVLSWKLKIVA